ncbi:MAG: UDP-N-acetylmuramoyl-L-alanyl-D-glutamate--2,6-diaminopimelate ligase [Methylomonas sp.]|nr:MAG: UDP-N-acetylmuramoyl-L-alanyl-D-glutamate--2,6-diaminopimelate ligase [Methylomonas sp.]
MLAQILPDCGVIGTLGWGDAACLQPTLNTTPDAMAIHQMLHRFVAQNKTAVVMEVSSHGLAQGRVDGISFTGAVFTNLSRDHLDYHGSMENYLQAKLLLFKNPGLRFAVVNIDDENGQRVLDTLAPEVKRWTFSVKGRLAQHAECLTASNVIHDTRGMAFDVHWNGRILRVRTSICGAFNVQNVMTVLSVLLALDWPFEDAVAALTTLQAVAGRLEKYGGQGKPTVYVDYAHTPDALEKVLRAIHGEGRLWVVFGCGGDRDSGKRPQMGRIAEACADHVIITDDNPRTEDPQHITAAILAGCLTDKVRVINDRRQAIEYALTHAANDDHIVIAGKGHENYQEIQGVKTPFSDQAIVIDALARRGCGA